MSRNASISLNDREDGFIALQLETGKYRNEGDVIGAGLRLLEDHESRLDALRQALIEGEESGEPTPLDMEAIIRTARKQVGLAEA